LAGDRFFVTAHQRAIPDVVMARHDEPPAGRVHSTRIASSGLAMALEFDHEETVIAARAREGMPNCSRIEEEEPSSPTTRRARPFFIETTLGAHAASRSPAGMCTCPLPVAVHQYAADVLHYLAPKRGQSVQTLLSRILDEYTIQHITELVTTVPSYRDSLPNLMEATIARADAAVRRHRRP
jgi:hypothetical protein